MVCGLVAKAKAKGPGGGGGGGGCEFDAFSTLSDTGTGVPIRRCFGVVHRPGT